MLVLQNAAPARRARAAGPAPRARCRSAERTTAKFDLTLWRSSRGRGRRASPAPGSTPPTSSTRDDGGGCSRTSRRSSAAPRRRRSAALASCRCSAPAERQQLLARVERHGVGLPARGTAPRPVRGAGGGAAGRGGRGLGRRAALSYGELDRRAGRLARRLRRLGVGGRGAGGARRSSARRSWWSALLGILKAGGAYLPLDPAYPRERLALLLADAAPAAVVGPRRLLAALARHGRRGAPPGARGRRGAEADAGADDRAVGADVPPASLAYVLYTSGSTGQPKGVEVTHRGGGAAGARDRLRAVRPRRGLPPAAPMSVRRRDLRALGAARSTAAAWRCLPPGPFALADALRGRWSATG